MYKAKHRRRKNVTLGYVLSSISIISMLIAFTCTLITSHRSEAIAINTIDNQKESEVILPIKVSAEQLITIQSFEHMNVLEQEEDFEEKSYTDEEVKLLGDLMYAEEGVLFWKISYEDAKLAHQLAGSVVIHRKNHERFAGETIQEIIYTKGQYATTTLEKLGNIDTPEEVYEWAEELLRDGPIGPENLVWQSEFEQGPIYKMIYNQYFCLLEE